MMEWGAHYSPYYINGNADDANTADFCGFFHSLQLLLHFFNAETQRTQSVKLGRIMLIQEL